MSLSPQQMERYRRQILLKEIGGQGQQALLKAKVLIIGAGGLGCPIATFLAGAGIGRLTLIDPDVIERSNLQRQFLFMDDDIGKNKAEIAAKRLSKQNPDIEISALPEALTGSNAEALFAAHDLVIEGVDRFAPRYVINAASMATRTPFISSAVGRFDGQIAAFAPWQGDGPCYQCLVPEAPEDGNQCEELGVMGASCGIIGAQAALEAIKIITDTAPLLFGALLVVDSLHGTTRRVRLKRDPACPMH